MKRVMGAVLTVAAIAMVTGASAQTRGVTATEVTFGMPTDISGPAATYGVSSSNGIKMRFEEANEQGGIFGRKLKLIVEDQAYQVPKAVQACNKLINRDKVFAFIGPLGTPMNNACFKDQFATGVPNLFPLSSARSMYEPFERLKFIDGATYVDQIRSGINYFVKNKGVQKVCVMYQDTDFGKEILEGAKEQTEKLGMKLVETTSHKPTDQDFTAPITKLREAGCQLVAMGASVKDAIIPYNTARKAGWNDVVFLGAASSYDSFVGAAPGMDGFYAMGLTEMPYVDSPVPSVKKFVEDYKKSFNVDPNIGAVYGYVGADLTVLALKNAGKDLTTDSFIKGMEAIKDYHDIFNGPPINFSDKIRQGANSSFLAEVKGGRWTRVTQPLGF
jgi:branched-chain amino acid transport system substrate-binding protein